MIDAPARRFLELMANIAQHRDQWEATRRVPPAFIRTTGFVQGIQTLLGQAGRAIGLHPRFDVEAHVDELGKCTMEIIPRNGAATRMMARYEQLLLEDELNKG